MTQISNEVAGIIHAVASVIVSQIASVLFFTLGGGIVIGLFSGVPVIASLVHIVVSVIAVYVGVLVSAYVMRMYFSYVDRARVISVATTILCVVSILMSLPSLLSSFILYTLIMIAVNTFIFYTASKSIL